MDLFKEIIDNYLTNIEQYNYKQKISFECIYGELIFIKHNKMLSLCGIYIHSEYRKQGLCRDILYYIIDKCYKKFDYFCVESVISNILYKYLERFIYKNKKFKKYKIGFTYKIN